MKKQAIMLLLFVWFGGTIFLLQAQNIDAQKTLEDLQFSTTLVEPNSFQTTSDTPKPQKESYAPPTIEQAPKRNKEAKDETYWRYIAQERKPLPYPPIREADVFWQKRIWRELDLQQKMNQAFVHPKDPFMNVLMDIAAQKKDAYLFADESFETPIDLLEVKKSLGLTDTIIVLDPKTYQEYTEIVTNEFDWQSVVTFRFKEDWIFDEATSRMHVRILGIAPIMNVLDEEGNQRGQRALFWAYYPSFRKYLANVETFNRSNDGVRLTWDDILEARMFASNIVKESNIYDRRIKDYAVGKDALLEAERIKQELMEMEHNLWSY